ncbi:MAG: hypothetical protein HDQ88_01765 [Clostridia bacterium]|nr:hypothetical protein [Clostridia bacterium]
METNNESAMVKGIEIAKILTKQVADMKDWRVRSKRQRAMREIAREWAKNKCYFAGTPRDLRDRYGDLVEIHETAAWNDVKFIWACYKSPICNNISFKAVTLS